MFIRINIYHPSAWGQWGGEDAGVGGEGIDRKVRKIMWIVVQTGAMGKGHTKAFSQAAHQLGIQERFLHQGLKLPFHSQHCVYEAGWSYCSIGPQKIWQSHSLSKYDANHWVRANLRSPQQKALPSQSTWQTKCILRGDQ